MLEEKKGFSTKDVEEWFSNYSDYLFAFAVKRTQDPDLSKDLVQDTFIAAFKGIDGFKGNSQPKTWLTSILNRKIIDHWRKQERMGTDVASHFFQGDEAKRPGFWILEHAPSQQVAAHDKQIEQEEQVNELSDCIEALPAQWKGVVAAKYWEEKKGEEICTEFELSSSNYWVIIHRAKILLRDCLQKKWF